MDKPIKFEIHTTSVKKSRPFYFLEVGINPSVPPYKNWHENIELMYCTRGSGILHYDSIDYEIKEGDIAIINSYAIHSTTSDTHLLHYGIIPFSDFFRQNGLDLSKMHFSPIIRDSVATKKFEEIVAFAKNPDLPLSEAKLRLSVFDFLIYLSENHLENAEDVAKKIDISIRQALSFINSEYDKKLTADSISKNAGFSKFHFLREFKKVTGITLSDYLTQIRLKNSKAMLSDTTLPIMEISLKSGFESEAYFSKVFKDTEGITPSQYRKNEKAKLTK